MNKEQLAEAVRHLGDATITYKSAESNKLKYNVCTLDFDNAYIRTKQNRATEDDNTLLMFCWDIDAYRLLKPENVTSVAPAVPQILKEGRNVR